MENARSFVYHGATVVGDEALSVDAEVACRMAKVSADDAWPTPATACNSTVASASPGSVIRRFIRRAQWAQQMYGGALHHRKRLASLLLDNR